MRLWHKDLIPYLPRQQLIAQWRECCAIASNWANKGTPNHLLVNKVMEYPFYDFDCYTADVVHELRNRNYNISKTAISKYNSNTSKIIKVNSEDLSIFKNWHNNRYLKQCLMNLQEKYDCGGIPETEWQIIQDKFSQYLN